MYWSNSLINFVPIEMLMKVESAQSILYNQNGRCTYIFCLLDVINGVKIQNPNEEAPSIDEEFL